MTLWFQLLLSNTLLWAYIPEAKTILQQMARNAGKRPYQIEQEITFRSPSGNTFRVNEKWIVIDNRNLFLTATSKLGDQTVFKMNLAYIGSQRITKNSKSELIKRKWSSEFYMPLLFTKSSQGIAHQLQVSGAIPDDYDLNKPLPKSADEFIYTGNPFVKLTRRDGRVNFKIAQTQSSDASTVWVDQDSFAISGLRYNSGLRLNRNRLERFKYGLYWPHQSEVIWNGKSAKINLLQLNVRESTDTTQLKKVEALPPNILDEQASQEFAEQIREFYSRVR